MNTPEILARITAALDDDARAAALHAEQAEAMRQRRAMHLPLYDYELGPVDLDRLDPGPQFPVFRSQRWEAI